MRLSKSIWKTYKEIPADAEIPSHRLMIRAGLIHKSGSGLYSYMPFMLRIISKVEKIIRQEHEKVGAQEVNMTVVTPSELWKESGRWAVMDEMLKFEDKAGREVCISPTNEESVTDIFKKFCNSYKQLPTCLYQINTKFRDEIRPRFGLMRAREFIMKDAYSFHLSKKCLDNYYQQMYDCYCRIFDRMEFQYVPVLADAGAMADGDQKTHEFQVIADTGEDTLIFCKETNYAANVEKAVTKRETVEFHITKDLMSEVSTPNTKSIDEVSSFLSVKPSQCLKSLAFEIISGEDSEIVLLLVLGDDQLNEVNAKAYLHCEYLNPLNETQLKENGFVEGFIGPNDKVRIILDNEILDEVSYITGSNKKDFHLQNVIPKRDIKKYEKANLRLSREGDLDETGKYKVQLKKGIEVGQVFQLGQKYSKSMQASVLGIDGKPTHPYMGCYGIGVTRVIAAAIEQNHDDHGIIWPKAIAPYQVYLGRIGKSEEIKKIADDIYELLSRNFEVLYDDRDGSPGIMFKDSDLLGLPFRVVVGEREYLKTELLEITNRKTGETQKLNLDEVIKLLKDELIE